MYFQRNWHLEISSRLAQNSQKDIDCCFVHRLLTRSRRHYLPIAIALLEPNISKNNQMNEKIMQKWQLSKTQCDKHTTGLLELQIRQNVWIKKNHTVELTERSDELRRLLMHAKQILHPSSWKMIRSWLQTNIPTMLVWSSLLL